MAGTVMDFLTKDHVQIAITPCVPMLLHTLSPTREKTAEKSVSTQWEY